MPELEEHNQLIDHLQNIADVGSLPIVGGVNLNHNGDKMEITKLTIVDGIITELEFGV